MMASNIECAQCDNEYTPSVTSNKEYCGICLSRFSVASLGINPTIRKTALKPERQVLILHPESWGKPPEPDDKSESCVCTTCGEIFRSLTGFDWHRTGEGHERSCLDSEGMRKLGMSINAKGKWITCEYSYVNYKTH